MTTYRSREFRQGGQPHCEGRRGVGVVAGDVRGDGLGVEEYPGALYLCTLCSRVLPAGMPTTPLRRGTQNGGIGGARERASNSTAKRDAEWRGRTVRGEEVPPAGI